MKVIERIIESQGAPGTCDLWIKETQNGPTLYRWSGGEWKPILGGGGGDSSEAVRFVPQDLTESQKEQARENIGLEAVAYMGEIVGSVN